MHMCPVQTGLSICDASPPPNAVDSCYCAHHGRHIGVQNPIAHSTCHNMNFTNRSRCECHREISHTESLPACQASVLPAHTALLAWLFPLAPDTSAFILECPRCSTYDWGQALKGYHIYTLAYERGTAGCISKMPMCDSDRGNDRLLAQRAAERLRAKQCRSKTSLEVKSYHIRYISLLYHACTGPWPLAAPRLCSCIIMPIIQMADHAMRDDLTHRGSSCT